MRSADMQPHMLVPTRLLYIMQFNVIALSASLPFMPSLSVFIVLLQDTRVHTVCTASPTAVTAERLQLHTVVASHSLPLSVLSLCLSPSHGHALFPSLSPSPFPCLVLSPSRAGCLYPFCAHGDESSLENGTGIEMRNVTVCDAFSLADCSGSSPFDPPSSYCFAWPCHCRTHGWTLLKVTVFFHSFCCPSVVGEVVQTL